MRFEIVNHTHNYARLLAWQLSSLILYPTNHSIMYTLYYDPADEMTFKVLNSFYGLNPAYLIINPRPMPVAHLRNRATGRNEVAKTTSADWVWFADTDYMFGNGCFDTLAETLTATDAKLVWPGGVMETDWPSGDRMIEMVRPGRREALQFATLGDSCHLDRKLFNRAIGGIQIAHGPTINKIGYCPEMAGPPSNHWNFRSDIRFRRSIDPKKKIDIPNVIRIRHTNKGYGQPNCHEVVN